MLRPHTLLSVGLVALGCSSEPRVPTPGTSAAPRPEASGPAASVVAPTAGASATTAPSAPTTGVAASALPDGDVALARRLVAEGAPLVDVRTPKEYGERHLDHAVNLPVDDLAAKLADVDAHVAGGRTRPI
ncbi:MAG: hypothetical protein HY908_21825, partial [Myxococcales bacterium]|nr:hypothetical protein [Myxococcales bacterium]